MRCEMRCATIIRMPPALSAPAMPRKIVTSSLSIFSQIRCARPRFRPWNEMDSMRARTSAAVRPCCTVKGLTGVRRYRDLSFMRRPLEHTLFARPRRRTARDRSPSASRFGGLLLQLREQRERFERSHAIDIEL